MADQGRLGNYKNKGKTADKGREERASMAVQLRKEKRLEQAMKRRNINAAGVDTTPPMLTQELQTELPKMLAGVRSADREQQLEHVTTFRKILSKDEDPPIKEVIWTGIVPRFVELLTASDCPQLQFEAAWALTNVASGDNSQTRAVIDAQAVPVMIQLLGPETRLNVREQVTWCLGNISGDGPDCRDYVLRCGIFPPLMNILREPDSQEKLPLFRNAVWTLSNLCRGKKPRPPDFALVSQSLPVLATLLYSDDEEILTDACWTLSYLSDGDDEKISRVIDTGVCRRLVELLLHPTYTVVTPALRTLGNIVTGDDRHTQTVLNCQVLANLRELLKCQKESVKKEACWMISNITAGNVVQVQAVISANIFPTLIDCLAHAEFKTKKEAAWAIANATSSGTDEQIKYIVSQGCIKPICDLLRCKEWRIVEVALDTIENILRIGQKQADTSGQQNQFAIFVEECGGLDKIEFLQSHDHARIFKTANDLIGRYWSDDGDLAAGVEEPVAGGGHFAFPSSAAGQPSAFNFQ